MDAIQSKSNSGGLLFTCHVWKIPPWISPDLAPFVFFWTQRGISNRYPTKLNQKLKSHVYCLNGIFLTPTWPPGHPVLPLGIADRGAAHFLRAEAGDDQEITLALQQGIHLQQNPAISPTKTWQMLSNCVGYHTGIISHYPNSIT